MPSPFDQMQDVVAILNGSTSVTMRESIPGRIGGLSDVTTVLVTATMTSVAVPVWPGDVIRGMATRSGATAAGTPTNWWFALYDSSGALLGQTPDQLTATWNAGIVKDLTFTTSIFASQGYYSVTKPDILYATVSVTATTVPSLYAQDWSTPAWSTGIMAGQKVLSQQSGSGLTGTAPATIAAPTVIRYRPMVVLHS